MIRLQTRLLPVLQRLINLLPRPIGLRIYAWMEEMAGKVELEMLELPQALQRRRLALDIGSNNGVTTLRLARRFEKVEAFEANPRLATYSAPGLPNNARVISVALSDKPGESELNIPVAAGVVLEGWASLDKPQVGEENAWKRVRVETRTLDSFQFENVDFIKIDVEGHELAVLNGAQETLVRCSPWLLIEVWDEHRQAVSGFLAHLGYRQRDLQELRGMAGSAQNLIFSPPNS